MQQSFLEAMSLGCWEMRYNMLGMSEQQKTYSKFGNKLREYRKMKGFSQFQLAIKMGKTPSAVTQYEYGQRNPSRTAIHEIGDALRLSRDEKSDLLMAAGFLPEESADALERVQLDLRADGRFDERAIL
jgi:transcriptional regulator with XRE-family HTH domain